MPKQPMHTKQGSKHIGQKGVASQITGQKTTTAGGNTNEGNDARPSTGENQQVTGGLSK